MKRCLVPVLLVALLGPAAPAAADEPVGGQGPATALSEDGAVTAIQNRKHVLRHELTLAVGTIPIDAYYKGLTGTGQYTFHFGPSWAWEIVSFTYSQNFWTTLRKDLEYNWRAPGAPKIPEMQFFGDSNLVWKPLYGKLAYLNRSLVYGELYWVIGAAGARYTETGNYIGADTGLGFRVHMSEHFSARLDLRYYRFQQLHRFTKNDNNDNLLLVQLGISLNLGGTGVSRD
ncbi:MAG TPA: outer membrane beta-barrel domain-containing protein [Polyangia bacterium]|jgi:outer membrane beta-barrel protein